MRALDERVNGAQWVVWAGQPVAQYEWADPPIRYFFRAGSFAGLRTPLANASSR